MGATVSDNEQSQPNEAAAAAMGSAVRSMLIGAIPGLIGAALTAALSVYVTLAVTETNVEKLQLAVDSIALRVAEAEKTLVDFNRRGHGLQDRLDKVEGWQEDQGKRIRDFYASDWPKVEVALDRINGVKEEIAGLRREIRRLRR